jgi:prephenate dehydrogenase
MQVVFDRTKTGSLMGRPPLGLGECEVAIVGLGLMGGSLALALKGQVRALIGVDRNAATCEQALARGIVDQVVEFESAHNCDLLILATPVRTILRQVAQLSGSAFYPPRATIVMDLGSTKRQVMTAMADLPPRFEPVGGHPMCGREVSGLANASADLYRGKTFVLTPPGHTSVRALSLAYELVERVGGRLLVLSAEHHDQLAALVSHLPYAAAVALVRAVQANGDEQAWEVAASGFRDSTRVAASDLDMMTDILVTNRGPILRALAAYHLELANLATAIESGDANVIRRALHDAHARRASMFKDSP